MQDNNNIQFIMVVLTIYYSGSSVVLVYGMEVA